MTKNNPYNGAGSPHDRELRYAWQEGFEAGGAETARLRELLKREEDDHTQTIMQRDAFNERIDDIANALGDETEWSNVNDRGENAVELAMQMVVETARLREALVFESEAHMKTAKRLVTTEADLATARAELARTRERLTELLQRYGAARVEHPAGCACDYCGLWHDSAVLTAPPAPVSHGDATVHTGDWVSYSDSLSTLYQNLEALQPILPFGYVPLDQEPAPVSPGPSAHEYENGAVEPGPGDESEET